MRLSRWHVLSAAYLAIFTGQGGPWGVFSDTIKTNFGLSQSQLDTVPAPGNIHRRISKSFIIYPCLLSVPLLYPCFSNKLRIR